ncbi:hypothetical protein MRS44_012604 [Fusarium solani]|uniref:uncharacterized protein n=1 Tax=Fusarium solani TaxID=169388 RepID=UPI0032C4512A|nr:hypothetical protein MRS44_012604 [Fusarium solani]
MHTPCPREPSSQTPKAAVAAAQMPCKKRHPTSRDSTRLPLLDSNILHPPSPPPNGRAFVCLDQNMSHPLPQPRANAGADSLAAAPDAPNRNPCSALTSPIPELPGELPLGYRRTEKAPLPTPAHPTTWEKSKTIDPQPPPSLVLVRPSGCPSIEIEILSSWAPDPAWESRVLGLTCQTLETTIIKEIPISSPKPGHHASFAVLASFPVLSRTLMCGGGYSHVVIPSLISQLSIITGQASMDLSHTQSSQILNLARGTLALIRLQ